MHEPYFGGKEKEYLNQCIESTFVSSVGPFVNQFEDQLAEYCGTQNAVAVVNGTAALHISLEVLGVTHGDEVLTQSLTFIATANAISYCGAKPVFIDVDRGTMGMSPSALHSFLETNAEKRDNACYNKKTGNRISACVPMHTYGFAAEIDQICAIARQWNIPVIEDAAEAIGSSYKEKSLGTYGDIGVFSFNGNKIITGGGGGADGCNSQGLTGGVGGGIVGGEGAQGNGCSCNPSGTGGTETSGGLVGAWACGG